MSIAGATILGLILVCIGLVCWLWWLHDELENEKRGSLQDRRDARQAEREAQEMEAAVRDMLEVFNSPVAKVPESAMRFVPGLSNDVAVTINGNRYGFGDFIVLDNGVKLRVER